MYENWRRGDVRLWPGLHNLQLPASGMYSLSIRSQDPAAPALGAYHLFLMGPRLAPGIVPGDVVYGSNLRRDIAPGVLHWYAFEGRAGEPVSLLLNGRDLAGLDFFLFAPDGRRLDHDGYAGTNLTLRSWNNRLPADGRYLVAMTPFYGPGHGTYSFRLYGPGLASNVEPIALTQRIFGTLGSPNGQSLYRFEAGAGDAVTVHVQNFTEYADGSRRGLVQGILFGPDGAYIQDYATEHATMALMPWGAIEIPETATYTLAIAGQSGSTGMYSVYPTGLQWIPLRYNSSVEASPYWVDANGESAARVVVTLRNEDGQPVAGKQVTLRSSRGEADAIVQPAGPTDAAGQATGSVRSTTPGEATISAHVEGDAIDVLQASSLIFAAPEARTGVAPPPESPYYDRNIIVEHQPIISGRSIQVRVPVRNPYTNPIRVRIEVGVTHLGLGLYAQPIGTVSDLVLQPGAVAAPAITWVPDATGHHCFAATIRVEPAGAAASASTATATDLSSAPAPWQTATELTEAREESRQRNVGVEPAPFGSKQYWQQVEVRAEDVNKWALMGVAGSLPSHPAGFYADIDGMKFDLAQAARETDRFRKADLLRSANYSRQEAQKQLPWARSSLIVTTGLALIAADAAIIQAFAYYIGHDPPREDFRDLYIPDYTLFELPPPESSAEVPGNVAAAVEAYLRNEMRIYPLVAGVHISLERYQGAVAAGDGAWAARQYAAYLRYTEEAATHFAQGAVLTENLVAAFRASGEADVTVTVDQIKEMQQHLAEHGYEVMSDELLLAFHYLGVGQEVMNAEILPRIIAADPNDVPGSLSEKLLQQAALYRRATSELVSGQNSAGSGSLRAKLAEQTGAGDPTYVATGRVQSTFTVGNPKTVPATLDLKVRPVDLPPGWQTQLSESSLTLEPGQTRKVTLTLTPTSAGVQGKVYRAAVEGYIGNEFIGGVEVQAVAPPEPDPTVEYHVLLPAVQRSATAW